MKKLLAIILSSALLFSCSKPVVSKLSKDSKTQNIAELPEWVVTPDVEDGIAAVGIASPSVGGIKFQIPQAETDAKANIATAVGSEISRITKDALREAKIGEINDVEQTFSQATKEVVKNMPMSGVKRLNMYQAEDGTLYIRMVLKDVDYSKYLKNSQKMYENRLKQAHLSRENLNKSQEAVKVLFDELDKERDK
ncbi:MAG: putative lipoprotein [Rickettsiaceae bacterium]|jgi:hypothetical protein|nr:putative lipoprotein [Rickettsiaceae bacterium]